MDFAPFWMAHTPLKMTIQERGRKRITRGAGRIAQSETQRRSEAISDAPFRYRVSHLVSRLFFRGIYFPQMNRRAWLKLIFENRRPIYGLTREAIGMYRSHRKHRSESSEGPAAVMNEQKAAY
jgi:hypothetical protein